MICSPFWFEPFLCFFLNRGHNAGSFRGACHCGFGLGTQTRTNNGGTRTRPESGTLLLRRSVRRDAREPHFVYPQDELKALMKSVTRGELLGEPADKPSPELAREQDRTREQLRELHGSVSLS